MSWRLGAAVLLLVWSVTVAARHSSGVLDPRRATPGIRLELVELRSDGNPVTKKYRLRAEGVPRGTTFAIWTKDFGQQFIQVSAGFRMNESGELVSVGGTGQSQRLEDFTLDPGPYPNGAAWMVALASDDHQLSAFAKVIPHPIVARDGPCTVSMELISLHGNRFVASGDGFTAGEEVDIEMRSSGRVIQKKQRISPDGLLLLDVVSHGAIGTDFGARYMVKGLACGPVVEYEWGDAALIRR